MLCGRGEEERGKEGGGRKGGRREGRIGGAYADKFYSIKMRQKR